MNQIEPDLLKILSSVDTPTVCNAIEVVQGQRGFNRFTKGTVLVANPNQPAICGFARTASIRGREPSPDDPADVRKKRMDYYRYMSEGPRPAIAVVQDLDFPNCIAGYWGEVNSTVHKGFKLSGALTNGTMRDLDDLAPDFQVLAGSIGPSHGFVHVVDFDNPIQVFEMDVRPGEFIHADKHGAVVIPQEVLPEIGEGIRQVHKSEQLVLAPAREDDFDFEKFEASWTAFEKART